MEAHKPTIITIASLVKNIIPTGTNFDIKGDNGSIATIGGSLEYTGAPYYSGITGLKAGSDLSHIFCHVEAAIPIKSYSPEGIVHPAFNTKPGENEDGTTKTIRWFKSMNAIAFGPGLGRSEEINEIFIKFSNAIFSLASVPGIYDADALYFMSISGKSGHFNDNLIITPNHNEFKRGCNGILDVKPEEEIKPTGIENTENDIVKYSDIQEDNTVSSRFKSEINLCKALDYKVIIVKKGPTDIITNGKDGYMVNNKGSLKRTGGIGDIGTGLITSYCGMKQKRSKGPLSHDDLMKCSVFGCYICREVSRMAYGKHLFSLTAPDIINELVNISQQYSNWKV